jgi:flagellar hook protein FlgE
MSITSAMYTGVSGLLANSEAMNVIGNNISNVNTIGFKDGRAVFADLLSEKAGNDSQIGRGVAVQTVQNVFSQGASQNSENVTDLSIQGSSFFALQSPTTPATSTSNAFLSRAGAFHVDKNLTLVNPDGYQVLDSNGQAIKFAAPTGTASTDFGKITNIDSNGIITFLAADGVSQYYYQSSGSAGVPVASGTSGCNTVAVVTASDPGQLSKIGGSLYQASPDAGVGSAWGKPNGTSEKILSNSLEGSNVDMASEFVNMIVTQRAYSANSKTITTTDQMTQEVLGLIR